ncbi:unnamed protein product [Urochloa decumbens]|uniref:Uncharacterized protein n=1 Tax=Urochloa decumbens TaxID=240449 RepID=A0ABC8WZJ2_9POAL
MAPQRVAAMAVACFHFLRSLLLCLGRPLLNKLPSSFEATKTMEDAYAFKDKRGMDGMTKFMECVGDTSQILGTNQPSPTDDKHDCSLVAGANDEPSDGQMSKESERASRAQEIEENNAILRQEIVQLQQALEQSDASLAFKKNEYNQMICIVRKFFSYFSPPEKASEAAVSFIMAEGNFGQQVACMQDFLRCFTNDRKFGIKYHRRKKKNLAEPTPN